MKIGIACTNSFTVPPPKNEVYANQKIAGWIADELSRRNFDVTLFAPIGSKTRAKLVTFNMLPYSDPSIYKAFDNDRSFSDYERLFLAKIYNFASRNNFDILHMHLRPLSVAPFSAMSQIPTVQTIHDSLHYKYFKALECYNEFNQIAFVSVSRSQSKTRKRLKVFAVVYNGIQMNNWKYKKDAGEYLCWAGRILPEKGTHIAIRVANKMNMKLKMAGFVYSTDKKNKESYWNAKVKPNLLCKNIELKYLTNSEELSSFYRNAKVFINPLQWEEPFGLVMIEAMACGTPVVAFNKGSANEIIRHGETGFVVENEDEMIDAIKNIDKIKRAACRRYVKERFTVEKMVDRYERVYKKLCRKKI